MNINAISGAVTGAASAGGKVGKSEDFGNMLKSALKEVNNASAESTKLVEAFAAGKNVEMHQVMIAMEKASTAMQLTLQVRNKLLESYLEINRMQV